MEWAEGREVVFVRASGRALVGCGRMGWEGVRYFCHGWGMAGGTFCSWQFGAGSLSLLKANGEEFREMRRTSHITLAPMRARDEEEF